MVYYLIGDLRVLKLGNIEAYETAAINHLNVTNFQYLDSQMPFFDLLGSLNVAPIMKTSNDIITAEDPYDV
jgi:hypothetical protein